MRWETGHLYQGGDEKDRGFSLSCSEQLNQGGEPRARSMAGCWGEPLVLFHSGTQTGTHTAVHRLFMQGPQEDIRI